MTEHFTDDAAWPEQAGTGAQARVCLARVESALAALGAGRQDIIRTTIYLAPGARWEQALAVVEP